MNTTWMTRTAAVLALFALGACDGKGDSDTATTSAGATTGTTGGTPAGTTTPCGGEFTATVSWTDDGLNPPDSCDGDSVDIEICDPIGMTVWDFGMAETGALGWTGEDCFNGYAGYNHCHPISTSASLTEVCTPDEVVDGQTTLLDASKDPFVTYFLDDGTTCYVFGADTAYYTALACVEMM